MVKHGEGGQSLRRVRGTCLLVFWSPVRTVLALLSVCLSTKHEGYFPFFPFLAIWIFFFFIFYKIALLRRYKSFDGFIFLILLNALGGQMGLQRRVSCHLMLLWDSSAREWSLLGMWHCLCSDSREAVWSAEPQSTLVSTTVLKKKMAERERVSLNNHYHDEMTKSRYDRYNSIIIYEKKKF